MYIVQARTATVHSYERIGFDWQSLVHIPPLDTEQDELQAARSIVVRMREHYTRVRIVKQTPDRKRKVVR